MTTLAAISLAAPAFALGVGLIVLPIAAHLLNRKAKRRVTFPSIELLVSASASQSSLFKLRRWWLLLLRCLAVLAIVLAFMQPMWLSAQAQQAAGRGGAVVIVMDTSASTGQLQGGVPAIRAMRADADRVLDALTPGEDHANIIYATARPYSAFASMTTNTDALRVDLPELEPTYERADMVGALFLAGKMLAEHAGPRRLVIVSDMQESNWLDALNRFRRDTMIPEGTRVTVLPPSGPPPTNLSLHAPSAHPATPRIGQPLSLSVTLTNHSDRVQPATVRVSIDGRPMGSQSLTIEPRQRREVVFSTMLDRPGEHRVIFSLPADALTIDDQCYLVTRAVKQTPVILITDDNTGIPETAGYFTVRALAPHGDARDRYDVQIVPGTGPFPPTMHNAAAVFVGQTGLLEDYQLTELLRYIERGGGVIFFCGDAPAAENLAALDRLKPDAVLPWQPDTLREWRGMDEPLTIIGGDWRSPLLARFDEAAQRSLSQIRFHHAWSGGKVDQNARILLHYADGTPALVSREVGAGRLMIANFSAAAHHSDLGKHGLFVALMQGLADELLRKHQSSTDNLVGRAASITTSVPIDRRGLTLHVYPPDGRTPIDATLALNDHTSAIIISEPNEPGFYTAQQGDTLLGTVAINIDPRESILQRINADALITALQTNGIEADFVAPDVASPLMHHARDLWGWLLIFACVFLGFEMFLLGHWRR